MFSRRNRFNSPQMPSKVVISDIEDEYREDEEAYNPIINTNGSI